MDKAIDEQFQLFEEYIRSEGLRMTHQREMVVRTFLQTDGHISTEELYELARKRDSKIGYATVFRTLKALTECGLARETDLNDGRTRFEHLYKRPYHHHIVCVECKGTIEFYSPELEKLQEQIVERYDFEPVRNKFQIFGICKNCRNEKGSQHTIYDSDLVFARDALRIAMETEKRGVNFYTTAAELVADPATRETFLFMLEDEKSHLSGLEKEWKRLIGKDRKVLDAPVFLHFDYETLKRIFPSREEIMKKLDTHISEVEALKLAMQMEKEAHDFFREYAEKFNDTRGKDVFLQFAEEEKEHYETIRTAYERYQKQSGRA